MNQTETKSIFSFEKHKEHFFFFGCEIKTGFCPNFLRLTMSLFDNDEILQGVINYLPQISKIRLSRVSHTWLYFVKRSPLMKDDILSRWNYFDKNFYGICQKAPYSYYRNGINVEKLVKTWGVKIGICSTSKLHYLCVISSKNQIGFIDLQIKLKKYDYFEKIHRLSGSDSDIYVSHIGSSNKTLIINFGTVIKKNKVSIEVVNELISLTPNPFQSCRKCRLIPFQSAIVDKIRENVDPVALNSVVKEIWKGKGCVKSDGKTTQVVDLFKSHDPIIKECDCNPVVKKHQDFVVLYFHCAPNCPYFSDWTDFTMIYCRNLPDPYALVNFQPTPWMFRDKQYLLCVSTAEHVISITVYQKLRIRFIPFSETEQIPRRKKFLVPNFHHLDYQSDLRKLIIKTDSHVLCLTVFD